MKLNYNRLYCAGAMLRLVFILLIASTYAGSAVPVSQDGADHVYPRFIQFPDGDGVMHQVDLEAEPDYELLEQIRRTPTHNLYQLYTRRNPTSPQTLVIDNPDSIRSSNFNRLMPTIVVVHGWRSDQNTKLNYVIRDSFLNKLDVNVVIVDWSRLASSDYVTTVMGSFDIGRGLGSFLAYLGSISGSQISSMHLVGFSVGAHVAGGAGWFLIGRPARITALDPAGPLWTNHTRRLNRDDAVYVEAIHTDGGYTTGGLGLGTSVAVADADFFPNGGITQPGCSTNACNHNRAWELFATTITYNHLFGTECANVEQLASDTCTGLRFSMGNEFLRKFGTGLFRVKTGSEYPF